MGTKQLLLITLGIIIVGTAIIVSVEVFDTQFSGQIKDMAIQQMHDLGTYAKTHYSTPVESGGGGGTYKGFKVPKAITEDALSWKFDFKFGNDLVYFLMISKKFVYNRKPLYLLGLHEKGELVSIRLYDPEKKKWETLFDKKEEKSKRKKSLKSKR